MAHRQQVDPGGRGSLQDTISATPRDTGVSSAAVDTSGLDQLAKSLSAFAEAGQEIGYDRFEDNVRRDTQEQLAEFRKMESENKGDFKAAVKAGEISFGGNPWTRKAVKRAFASEQANVARNEFLSQLNDPANPLYAMNDAEVGAAFDAHMGASAESYGLDVNDGDTADGYLASMLKGRSQAQDVVNRSQDAATAAQAEQVIVMQVQTDLADANMFEGIVASELISDNIQSMISTGMNPVHARQLVIDTGTQMAEEAARDGDFEQADRILKNIGNIPSGNGSSDIKSVPSVRKQLDATEDRIARSQVAHNRDELGRVRAEQDAHFTKLRGKHYLLVKDNRSNLAEFAADEDLRKGLITPANHQELMENSLEVSKLMTNIPTQAEKRRKSTTEYKDNNFGLNLMIRNGDIEKQSDLFTFSQFNSLASDDKLKLIELLETTTKEEMAQSRQVLQDTRNDVEKVFKDIDTVEDSEWVTQRARLALMSAAVLDTDTWAVREMEQGRYPTLDVIRARTQEFVKTKVDRLIELAALRAAAGLSPTATVGQDDLDALQDQDNDAAALVVSQQKTKAKQDAAFEEKTTLLYRQGRLDRAEAKTAELEAEIAKGPLRSMSEFIAYQNELQRVNAEELAANKVKQEELEAAQQALIDANKKTLAQGAQAQRDANN